MATPDHMARRALLKGALAAPALAVAGAPALASADTPVLRLYREWEDLGAQLEAGFADFSNVEFKARSNDLRQIECRMEALPTTCIEDLAAKLVAFTDHGVFLPVRLHRLSVECEAIVAGRV